MGTAANKTPHAVMDDNGFLTLAQWLSPAFPVGGFAYSHGLEAAIASGEVTDRTGVETWVSTILAHGSGRADAVLLAATMRPDADARDLAETARALAACRERWDETSTQGRAFTETVNALDGRDDPPMPLPVAVGRAAARLGLDIAPVVALYLQSFATNVVLAAVRFVPLGQTEGQSMITALRPLILDIAAFAATADPADITTEALGADLAAMAHETLDVRIFRS